MTSIKPKYWFAWFATLTVLISFGACKNPFVDEDAWSCQAESSVRWYEGTVGFSDYTRVTYSATVFGD